MQHWKKRTKSVTLLTVARDIIVINCKTKAAWKLTQLYRHEAWCFKMTPKRNTENNFIQWNIIYIYITLLHLNSHQWQFWFNWITCWRYNHVLPSSAWAIFNCQTKVTLPFITHYLYFLHFSLSDNSNRNQLNLSFRDYLRRAIQSKTCKQAGVRRSEFEVVFSARRWPWGVRRQGQVAYRLVHCRATRLCSSRFERYCCAMAPTRGSRWVTVS